MASNQIPLEDLTCQCSGVLREPVDQSCSQTFAEILLKNKNSCPVCKGSSSTDDQPHALQELLCSLHHEKLELFSLEDKELVCVTCQTSEEDKTHTCWPLDQAADQFKLELQTPLRPLQEMLVSFRQVKQSCHKTTEHIKNQAQQTECRIKEGFEKLYNFLRDEESARIAALRSEEEQKLQMINEKIEDINSEMESLRQTITANDENMKAEDVSLIQNIKVSVNRAPLASASLIDVAKHLGNLTFRVWEKMQSIVQYNPVILDPNTAHPSLILAEDLTSVTFTGANTEETAIIFNENANGGHDVFQLPDNPERFDTCVCVLGSEGFNSGIHVWDVEVGDSYLWEVGISTESNQRKGGRFFSGVWSVESNLGFYTRCPTQTKSPISAEGGLSRIRIRLDWDRGSVSFYDPLNEMHLETFTHRFNEKVYPFVWSRRINSPVRILPMACSVALEQLDDDDDDDDTMKTKDKFP